MSHGISVQTNEGISVTNELDDPEIKAMAPEPKQFCQENTSAAVNPTLAIAPTINNTNNNNQEQLQEDCEDVDSKKGRFSWKLIGETPIPYIIRVINGEKLKFVSIRMAETQLLKKYLRDLHENIHTCTSVKSHFITANEAKLLNDINENHANFFYGNETFLVEKHKIILLEDIQELNTFLEVCHKTLFCNTNSGCKEKCGFIRINSESIIPYCIKDNQKYVPLFYFEGNTENLIHQAVKLENWNLAYLKFCCKVQGIRDEYFASDSCAVISLDEIKNCYSTDTYFEDYWPSNKLVGSQFITNHNSTQAHPPGAWIRTPPEVKPVDNTIFYALTASAPVIPQHMPVIIKTYQNGQLANQIVNSYSTQTLSPSITNCGYSMATRNHSIAFHSYNVGSGMSLGNSLRNGAGYVIPPPLDQQLQLQQQQIITTPQTQQSYSCQSEHGHNTNTQPCNSLRNVGPIVITPATEIIDLSSPPSSPVLPTVQETSLSPIFRLKLMRIPERNGANDRNNAAYKIQKLILQGRIIHCINAKPYIYSNLLIILDDIVQVLLPSCTVMRCAHILQNNLKITLYCGNSEQFAKLRKIRHLTSIYPEDTPMAMLQDITHVWNMLKTLMMQEDQNIYFGDSSKRHRSS